MASETEAKPFDFAKQAKRYKPKSATVLAVKHTGAPITINTEHGSNTANEGDYIVQTGTRETTDIVPPSTKNGERVPGLRRSVMVPVLEVVRAEDFEALHEA